MRSSAETTTTTATTTTPFTAEAVAEQLDAKLREIKCTPSSLSSLQLATTQMPLAEPSLEKDEEAAAAAAAVPKTVSTGNEIVVDM